MKGIGTNLKLENNKNRLIKRTFDTVAMQLTKRKEISPDRKKRNITQWNMIDPDLYNAQFIADLIESSYSYEKITMALNMKKKEMKLPFVTYHRKKYVSRDRGN